MHDPQPEVARRFDMHVGCIRRRWAHVAIDPDPPDMHPIGIRQIGRTSPLGDRAYRSRTRRRPAVDAAHRRGRGRVGAAAPQPAGVAVVGASSERRRAPRGTPAAPRPRAEAPAAARAPAPARRPPGSRSTPRTSAAPRSARPGCPRASTGCCRSRVGPRRTSSDVPSAASDAWFAASASWSAVRLAETAASRSSRPERFVERVATTSAAGASGCCPRMPKSRNEVSRAIQRRPHGPDRRRRLRDGRRRRIERAAHGIGGGRRVGERVGGPVDGRREIPDRVVDLVGGAVEPPERPDERQQADHRHDDPDRPVGDQARAEPAQPLAEPDRPLGRAGIGHLRPLGDRPSRQPR